MNAISIPKQVSRRSVPRERLDNLLRGPFGGGIRRYVEVNDPAMGMAQDDKHVQHTKLNRRHHKEIHSNHVRHMILDERSPGLRWWFRPVSTQEARYGPLRHHNSKFKQLAVNLGCTPKRIGIGQSENERFHIGRQRRSPTLTTLGFPAPVEFEGPLVPAYDGIRLYDHKGVSPS